MPYFLFISCSESCYSLPMPFSYIDLAAPCRIFGGKPVNKKRMPCMGREEVSRWTAGIDLKLIQPAQNALLRHRKFTHYPAPLHRVADCLNFCVATSSCRTLPPSDSLALAPAAGAYAGATPTLSDRNVSQHQLVPGCRGLT